jgi:putative membrane protein
MNDRSSGWIIILVIILIIVFAGPMMFMGGWFMGPGMMGSGMMGYRGYGYGYGFNWPGAIVQIIVFLIFLGLIALGIYYLVGIGRPTGPAPSSRPLEILKERYAKGEITKEEYERVRQELS